MMFGLLIVTLYMSEVIAQPAQNVDFDKDYFGVVFDSFSKYFDDRSDNATKEVENMLGIVSKRFKWVSIYGLGADSQWNEIWPMGLLAAAGNINNKARSLQLVFNIGTEYDTDDEIMRQKIANAFSVADVANKHSLGSVSGIIITIYNVNEVREVVKLFKDYGKRAQESSLQLGVRSQDCKSLVASLFNPTSTLHHPTLDMLKFLDIIICPTNTNFMIKKSVSSEIRIVTDYFLQWKREFAKFKPNFIVIGETGWPSFDIVNDKFEPGHTVTFWLGLEEWARTNQFRVDMYSAFDKPGDGKSPRSNYGWWKRVKNETSDFNAFQEKIDYIKTKPATNPASPPPDHTMGIVLGTFGLVVFFGMLGGFLYKLLIVDQLLTPADIDAFENGLKSDLGVDGETEEAMKVPYDRSYEIPRTKLTMDIGNVLGRGAFGIVYKGKIQGRTGDVALKMTPSNCTATNLKSFLSEIKIMIHVGVNQNVVSIAGACTEGIKKRVIIIATEFCIGGSLQERLREYKAKLSTKASSNIDQYVNVKINGTDNDTFTQNCIQWSYEIACGMEHIASKKIIHADLATRNVLLTANGTAKITDFGLSRHLYEYTNYIKQSKEPLPWRWMAIESLKKLTFSTKSDVWSYAVTLFEIFSMGETPYPGLSWTVDFVNDLENGLRMKKPNLATADIYLTMRDCWNLEPDDRPSFSSLTSFFNNLLYETTYEI